MIRRPPRSTLDRSSAASDVYKRQVVLPAVVPEIERPGADQGQHPVSYTHLRAHETGRNLVCRLLLEKKKNKNHVNSTQQNNKAAKNKMATLSYVEKL